MVARLILFLGSAAYLAFLGEWVLAGLALTGLLRGVPGLIGAAVFVVALFITEHYIFAVLIAVVVAAVVYITSTQTAQAPPTEFVVLCRGPGEQWGIHVIGVSSETADALRLDLEQAGHETRVLTAEDFAQQGLPAIPAEGSTPRSDRQQDECRSSTPPNLAELSQILQENRTGWFGWYLDLVQGVGQVGDAKEFRIVNRTLHGPGESAIRAFQVECLALPFIEAQKYFEEPARFGFMSRLRKAVYGDDYAECDEFARWYTEVDRNTGLARFAFDMVRFAGGVELRTGSTGSELTMGLPAMEQMFQYLYLLTAGSVAIAFGDRQGMEQLEQMIRSGSHAQSGSDPRQ